MTDPTSQVKALPCLVRVEGSLASGVLIPGVAYKVVEVREYRKPTGIEGESPHISTVVRFDPLAATPTEAPDGLDAWLAREVDGWEVAASASDHDSIEDGPAFARGLRYAISQVRRRLSSET